MLRVATAAVIAALLSGWSNTSAVAGVEGNKAAAAPAQEAPPSINPYDNDPAVTVYRDVVYGQDDPGQQTLDAYILKSDKPTPVLVHVHAGWGYSRHSMKTFYSKRENLFTLVRGAGISLVSITHRDFKKHGFPAPMVDTARVVQFVRSKASQWNIDPDRIGAIGGSGGGHCSTWVALHDDLAAPKSDDPVARFSSRLQCVVPMWTPVDFARFTASGEGNAPPGIAQMIAEAAKFDLADYNRTPQSKDVVRLLSLGPYASKDDPPVLLVYDFSDEMLADPHPPVPAAVNDGHHGWHGVLLADALRAAGAPHIMYDDREGPAKRDEAIVEFLVKHLRAVRPSAASAAAGKEVRLLAVGNSFSGDATRHLPGFVQAAGHTLIFGHASVGGCPLAKHWSFVEAFEKDPNDPQGRPYTHQGRKVSLRELLVAEKWQYVTLQQFSGYSYKAATYQPYAKNLHDYAKKHAPQAEVLFHQTWAYREDDPLYKDGNLTQDRMFQGLRDAYQAVAEQLKCRVMPVGLAFQRVRQSPEWRFVYPDPSFDYANPRYPALPNQAHSLNVGYQWRKESDGQWRFNLDGHHASLAGQYLAAAVWFEFLYGQSVVDNAYVPSGLTSEDAAFLRRMAHATAAAQPVVPAVQWKLENPALLPPLWEIVKSPARKAPVYGLYTWCGEYKDYHDGIRSVGWPAFRIGGPMDDACMKELCRDGVEVMKTLDPRSLPGSGGKYRDRTHYDSDEAFIAAYVKGVEEFLERYGPDGKFFKDHPEVPRRPVLLVEIWNEPNFQYMIPDSNDRPKDESQREALYARLLPAAYQAVKKRWPSVQVVGFAAGGASLADIRFIWNVHKKDPELAKCYDILSTHHHFKAPPETFNIRSWGGYSIAGGLKQIRDILAKHGRGDAPIWYTETGWPVSKADGGGWDQPGVTFSQELQAAYVVRDYALALRLGVERLFVMSPIDTDNYNSGFFLRDKSWRPSAWTAKTMIGLMPHPKLLGAVSDGNDGLFAWEFLPDATKAGQQPLVTMAWNVTGPRKVDLPCKVAKAALVDMLGRRQVVESAGGKITVEVGPCPIYLVTGSETATSTRSMSADN